ncbi:hypothetical protein DRW07_06895 [Alteromonas sediminis]|uniref:Uncharacterized protein n=1 Tax=Alteromonas sediminis TaxID=2259342 RepID=A0A3N5YCY0_9ALTE|nr:CsiV family protein [Alteromonas sediminis]RPJ67255.1 hypothetical protein DRW07_06895 [Alteromonas sediminis]
MIAAIGRSAAHVGLLLSVVLPSFVVLAEEDWWFDVEVVIFDRGQGLQEIAEKFVESTEFTPKKTDWDIINTVTKPNVSWLLQSLPVCNPEPDWRLISAEEVYPLPTLPDYVPLAGSTEEESAQPVELDPVRVWLDAFAPEVLGPAFDAQIPRTDCFDTHALFHNTSSYPKLEQLPVVIDGTGKDESWGAHILDAEQHSLTELSQRIRRERKLTRLLHMAWRQPVAFGKDNAKTIRLYGGQNYADRFDAFGNALTETPITDVASEMESSLQAFTYALATSDRLTPEQIIQRIPRQSIQDEATTLNELWQIEGAMKVYLQYVNRVPYLHIENDFLYRQPIKERNSSSERARLANIPFSQLRRVISTQLHYFDHPMFGVLVEIRRYKKP